MTASTQLHSRLPDRLQPGVSQAFNLEVERLTDCGWTVETVYAALMRTLGPTSGPGAVIYQLRQLPDEPPTRPATPMPKWNGHGLCPDGHPGCELCYCDHNHGPTHHIKTDPWWGWPDTPPPDNYGPGWLRETAPPSPTNAPW